MKQIKLLLIRLSLILLIPIAIIDAPLSFIFPIIVIIVFFCLICIDGIVWVCTGKVIILDKLNTKETENKFLIRFFKIYNWYINKSDIFILSGLYIDFILDLHDKIKNLP